MIRRYGIDTSVMVRLVTGLPANAFDYCSMSLAHLVNDQDAEIFVSNQVIGETYIAVQHHYGVSKQRARTTIANVLRSGLVKPQNGTAVFAALEAPGGAGLIDRLISDGYSKTDHETLTLDRRMANLADTRLL